MDKNEKPKAVRNKPRFNGNCHHCGMKGHKKVDCWKLKENAATSIEDEVLFSAMEYDIDCGTTRRITFENEGYGGAKKDNTLHVENVA